MSAGQPHKPALAHCLPWGTDATVVVLGRTAQGLWHAQVGYLGIPEARGWGGLWEWEEPRSRGDSKAVSLSYKGDSVFPGLSPLSYSLVH